MISLAVNKRKMLLGQSKYHIKVVHYNIDGQSCVMFVQHCNPDIADIIVTYTQVKVASMLGLDQHQ